MHEAWRIDDPGRIAAIADAVAAAPVVIADGHHRYETCLAYRDERRRRRCRAAGRDDAASSSSWLDDELTVQPIHRLLSGLPDGFDLAAALEPFVRAASRSTPCRASGDRARSSVTAAASLDSVRPERVADVRPSTPSGSTPPWPRFPPTTSSSSTASATSSSRSRVGRGPGRRAAPTGHVAQIAAIAHGGDRMPPKTTFFWPKPRTGFVFRASTSTGDDRRDTTCRAIGSTSQVAPLRQQGGEVAGALLRDGGGELTARSRRRTRAARRPGTRRSASARTGRADSRDRLNARPGSSRASSCTRMRLLADVGDVDDPQAAVGLDDHALVAVGAEADRLAVAERDQHVVADLLAGDLVSNAPSLKTLQFW